MSCWRAAGAFIEALLATVATITIIATLSLLICAIVKGVS